MCVVAVSYVFSSGENIVEIEIQLTGNSRNMPQTLNLYLYQVFEEQGRKRKVSRSENQTHIQTSTTAYEIYTGIPILQGSTLPAIMKVSIIYSQ